MNLLSCPTFSVHFIYYHIEPIGKEYLEQTIIEFRKNMQGVFEIIAYGEGKKDE